MAASPNLHIHLHGQHVGTLTSLGGDRSIFSFTQGFIDDANRPTLSLSFFDQHKDLIANTKPTQTSLLPFFSNLLPEGPLRTYLADKAGVKEMREFHLLAALGHDLPGAIAVVPDEEEEWAPTPDATTDATTQAPTKSLKFSLAGVQMKFSALKNDGKNHGLTIPVSGQGGEWIVKLPSYQFDNVPENEYAMMTIAKKIGIDVPEFYLEDMDNIGGLPNDLGNLRGKKAFAIKRFDRSENGPIHMEDFAQILGAYPRDKYEGSYRKIAEILAIEASDDDVREFIRRIVFSTLIGNTDMHLKNWSVIYPNQRNVALSPAYDFVSTIAYMNDEEAALKYARTKKMIEFNVDELSYLADKARIPKKLVLDTAKETVERFYDVWGAEKNNLPTTKKIIDTIEKHLRTLTVTKL